MSTEYKSTLLKLCRYLLKNKPNLTIYRYSDIHIGAYIKIYMYSINFPLNVLRYMVTSNELTACHNNIIQPQLRIFLKKLLMCTFGRILELKQILVGEDFSIYTYVSLKRISILYILKRSCGCI